MFCSPPWKHCNLRPVVALWSNSVRPRGTLNTLIIKKKKDTYHIDFRRTFCILSVRLYRLCILLYGNRDPLSYNHLDKISGGRRSENRVGGLQDPLKKNKAKLKIHVNENGRIVTNTLSYFRFYFLLLLFCFCCCCCFLFVFCPC